MAFATCNGINIYYEDHGSGEPLILLSGLGGDHTFWQGSLEPLSAHYRVITPDTRGIGQTDAPPGPYSMSLFAADLAALMDALGLPTAHILGFSMGGNIALQFALDYPDRVGRLVLAATHARVPTQIRYYVDAVLEAYERTGDARLMFDLIAPFLFSRDFLEVPGHEAYLKFDADDPYPQSLQAWKAQYLAQREFDLRPELYRINKPALIMYAGEDPFAPHNSAMELRQALPDTELVCVSFSGHLINFEAPEIFHRSVLSFLSGNWNAGDED